MKRFVTYLLASGVFLTATSELVVAGILNVIADEMSVSVALAGQFITAYSLAFAIGTPIVIAMTSRMGRKKLLAAAMSVFIIGCLISFMTSVYSVLLVARLILGISAGVFLVVSFSSVAKIVPPEKLGSAIGTIVLGFSSAMVFGVPIGIAISNWFSWQIIFLLLSILSIIILIGMIYFLPQIEGDAPVPFKKQFIVLANPIIVTGLFITFFRESGASIMYTYLTPFLESILRISATGIGMMMFIFGVSGIIGSRLGGLAADKWGAKRMIGLGLTLLIAPLAFLPLVEAIPIVGIALLAVWICSNFVIAPAMQTYFIQQAPQSANLVLGLNTSVVHLGLAAGAATGGLAVNSASTVLYHPWIASGVISLGLIAALISFSVSKRKQAVPA